MPIRIAIADEQTSLPVDRVRLRALIRRTLRGEGVTDAEISLALVDDPSMHELNRRHLNHDYPTDVLSFLLSPAAPLEGELIVSTDTAIRQATEYDWSAPDELALYIVHGTLHLCGYDDHSAADRKRMRERERVVLSHWGLEPHYSS